MAATNARFRPVPDFTIERKLRCLKEEGVFKEKHHFDAWGNIVKFQDGAGNNLTAFKILDRGYTGHDHLLSVGIIHMNGRFYDPVLHRFLSPDNFVQDTFNTQNFNRYAYVLNNPLMYTIRVVKYLVPYFTGIIEGAKNIIKHGVNFDHYNWNKLENAWQIDRGLFTGNFGQVLLKWTWGSFKTITGNLTGHFLNMAGKVESVSHLEGGSSSFQNYIR